MYKKIYETENLIIDPDYLNYKLCFVDTTPSDEWDPELKTYVESSYIKEGYTFSLYFSRLEPHLVWGDDWNDAPYEHNAGRPYDSYNGAEIVIVEYIIKLDESIILLPQGNSINSSYSVEDINTKSGPPWIRYHEKNRRVNIYPGDTLFETISKLKLIREYEKF